MPERLLGKFLLLHEEISVIGDNDRLDALAGEPRERAVDTLRVAGVGPYQHNAGLFCSSLRLAQHFGIVPAFGIEQQSHARQIGHDGL